MPKRLRKDIESYELRGAEVRVAKAEYLCDCFGCPNQPVRGGVPIGYAIPKGTRYAYVSTGLKICPVHFTDDEVEDV